jgi:hypothetical protein
MPNLDKTGPQGQGAMTGRKIGRCQNNQTLQIEKSESQTSVNDNIVYGLGRGGRPRSGGGLGNRTADNDEQSKGYHGRRQNRTGSKLGGNK